MKYGIIGYSGRMGKEIDSLFKEDGHELVFSYDKDTTKKEGQPEVIIDFSLPEAFPHSIDFIKDMKVPLIIGTTALTAENINTLKELSSEVAIVQSFNFSIGIQMLLKSVTFLKDNLQGWDVEITETHHRFKKDKPSGTAKMIEQVFDRPVNVSALRLGNVPGDHNVHFGGLGEIITVSHRALSRRTFAEGVLTSAKYILDKKNGFYTFTDVLFQ